MMKWLILGAGNCYGNNLAKYLLEMGHEVRGIGRSPRRGECFTLGVKFPYHTYHITYELQYVMRVINDYEPDFIVNFAAQGEGAASFNPEDYWRFYETNTLGLVKLVGELEKFSTYGRFIQIGTSELYGSVEKPSKESDPIIPTSPYAASKAAFDLHLQAIHKVRGFRMNIIRPSNCYCPGQQLHRIIPKTLLCAAKGIKLQLHGGGKSEKSYLHANDLNCAIHLVAEEGAMGEVYNVGPEYPSMIIDVVRLCGHVSKVPFADLVEEAPERQGQDSRYWLDSSKVKALGWKPEINLIDGVKDMWAWVRKYPELKEMSDQFVIRA